MLEGAVVEFELYQHARLKHDVTSDKYYIFNVDNGNHYNLNQTSFEILTLLEKNTPKNDIAKQMSKNYNVEVKLISADIENVTALLLKEKLGGYK